MSSRLVQGLLIVMAFILSVHFLREASSVFLPFLAAALLAFFAHPIVLGMSRRGLPMGVAIAAVVMGIVILFGGLMLLIHVSVVGATEHLPQYQSRLEELWQDLVQKIGFSPGSDQAIGEVKKQGTTAAAGVAGGVLGGLLAFVESVVLVFVYLIFFLVGWSSLPRLLDRAFGAEKRRKTMAILSDVEGQSLRYIGLRTVLCIVTGFVAWLILQLYGVEFALLFGVITFVAQYVPFAGPFVASLLPITVALLQFDSPMKALWVAIWLTLWHLLVGYLIEPRVFGKGMHLSQPLILLGLLFFAWLWGAAGAVLAVPLLVVAKSIFDNVRPLQPAGVILGGEE